MVFEDDSPTPSRMKKQRTTETIQVEANIATRMSDIASIFERSKGSCVRLMVSGSVSHCGKTTACLSILGAALNAGLTPEEIAYIKPATQCEAPDLLAAWTARHGIVNVSGKDAPLVFFAGFTRSAGPASCIVTVPCNTTASCITIGTVHSAASRIATASCNTAASCTATGSCVASCA